MQTPDSWVLVEHLNPEDKTEKVWRVIAGWSGGYLDGDSWRMSTPIRVTEDIDDTLVELTTKSGTKYRLHKQGEELRMSNGGVYRQLEEQCQEKGLDFKRVTLKEWFIRNGAPSV